MQEYHDRQWGVPVHDDRRHFEFLVLEASQAGLSWSVVLHKRAGYARAFNRFDPGKVARYSAQRIRELTQDPSITRNRRKIEAAVANDCPFLVVQKKFGTFDEYCWGYIGGCPRRNLWRIAKDVPATTPESDALSANLRKRGSDSLAPQSSMRTCSRPAW